MESGVENISPSWIHSAVFRLIWSPQLPAYFLFEVYVGELLSITCYVCSTVLLLANMIFYIMTYGWQMCCVGGWLSLCISEISVCVLYFGVWLQRCNIIWKMFSYLYWFCATVSVGVFVVLLLVLAILISNSNFVKSCVVIIMLFIVNHVTVVKVRLCVGFIYLVWYCSWYVCILRSGIGYWEQYLLYDKLFLETVLETDIF